MTDDTDAILQQFLRSVEEAEDRRLKLIFNVGGLLIEGTLVGTAAYLRALGDALAEGHEAENPHSGFLLRQMFGQQADAIVESRHEVDEELAHDRAYQFAHLIDVRGLVSGGLIRIEGRSMAWRIPIRSIDGYSIGTFF